jgi:hypothetical protein
MPELWRGFNGKHFHARSWSPTLRPFEVKLLPAGLCSSPDRTKKSSES